MKALVGQIGGRLENLSANSTKAGWLWRYSLSTLLVITAFATRRSLNPILRDALPFTFFVTSSILAAYFGGFGPGLYALLLGWLLGDYFFVAPVGSIGSYGKADFISLVATLGPSFIAILLIQLLHRARRNARVEIENRKRVEAELITAKQRVENSNMELERRVAERTVELEKSVKFLDNFCYSIAHDLRAPLRAMQGFTMVLQEDYAEQLDKTGRECGDRIIQSSQRMDKLILDLLDYGRLNHVKLHYTSVSLEEAIQRAISRNEEKIARQEATIRLRPPLPHIHADAALLHLIFYHLLDNALKFTQPGKTPKIEIWTEQNDQGTKIFVKDEGLGIDPQHQQRIFRLFETLQPAHHTETGVGLALVNKAVERMNGKIGVSSSQGTGSTFWIELPNAERPNRSVE